MQQKGTSEAGLKRNRNFSGGAFMGSVRADTIDRRKEAVSGGTVPFAHPTLSRDGRYPHDTRCREFAPRCWWDCPCKERSPPFGQRPLRRGKEVDSERNVRANESLRGIR